MAEPVKKKTRGAHYCCVVNCRNNDVSNSNIHFYRFPCANRDHEQRQLWISAVSRRNHDGTLWQPSSNTRICSQHFVGGEKSNSNRNPAYKPTIFPTCHVKPKTNTDLERFQRLLQRERRCPSVRQTDDTGDEVSVPLEKAIQACVKVRDNHSCTAVVTINKGTQTDPEPKCVFFCNLKTDEDYKGWFGIPKNFLDLLVHVYKNQVTRTSSSDKDRIMLVLVKLKTNLTFNNVATLFSIHHQTASKYFKETLKILHSYAIKMIYWPTREEARARLPDSFKGVYDNCHAILDCTEIPIEKPNDPEQEILTYSDYKSRNTVKFLAACLPSGEFTFYSQGYGGYTTDHQIVQESGFLDLIERGATYLADKGFPKLADYLEEHGSSLVMPPFKCGDLQNNREQNEEGYKCSSLGIHVESGFARLKLFKILKFVQNPLIENIDEIFGVCCFLANGCPDLIKQKK